MTPSQATDDAAPEAAGFLAELATRNAGVIGTEAQRRLAAARILIAGCGSIGGAAVEPLARLGVCDFVLADPGEYELNNLNRQNATFADIGRNKAQVATERVMAINPHARVRTYPDGVTAADVADIVSGCDLIVDGVDVTTKSGLRAKYVLHEQAHAAKLPLFTGWDMAGAQYVRVYDYRTPREVFDGQITAADVESLSMWQLLQRVVPARYVPLEMLTIALANLDNPGFSFPQLVYAADLFGALSARLVPQLLAGEPVKEHIYVDLHQASRSVAQRGTTHLRRVSGAVKLLSRLRSSGS